MLSGVDKGSAGCPPSPSLVGAGRGIRPASQTSSPTGAGHSQLLTSSTRQLQYSEGGW